MPALKPQALPMHPPLRQAVPSPQRGSQSSVGPTARQCPWSQIPEAHAAPHAPQLEGSCQIATQPTPQHVPNVSGPKTQLVFPGDREAAEQSRIGEHRTPLQTVCAGHGPTPAVGLPAGPQIGAPPLPPPEQ